MGTIAEHRWELYVGIGIAVAIDVVWFLVVRRMILSRHGRIRFARKLMMVLSMIVIAIFVIAIVPVFVSRAAK